MADVGRVINPLGLEAQLQGATMDALSTALNLAITVKDGRVQQTGFRDYPIAATQPMPYEIETVIVPSTAEPSGASVIAVPSAAALTRIKPGSRAAGAHPPTAARKTR